MRVCRICKICGDSYFAIKSTQFFCSRKCFKKDYYQRSKIKLRELRRSPVYPTKKCEYCSLNSRLNFDPIIDRDKFNAWMCPGCGATNRLIWQQRDNPNSRQIISEILISYQSILECHQTQIQQYETYRLPIPIPEQGNPNIVVLTCEMLDIIDIQKRNRKKIVFS